MRWGIKLDTVFTAKHIAFTFSELVDENQQGVKLSPPFLPPPWSGLRAKIYSYFKRQQQTMKIKKQKAQKSVSWKENLNFKIVKAVLEATQIDIESP